MHPERSQPERTRREDRHSNFYENPDNLPRKDARLNTVLLESLVRFRTMIGAGACAAASALALLSGAAPAQAATRCTWGGTPDKPTGTIQFVGPRGNTITPSPTATKFVAKGVVEGGGPCHGQLVTFDGQANAGSSCAKTDFEGRIIGLPGVASVWGYGVGTVVTELDYDSKGNLVGSDQPIAGPPNNNPRLILPEAISCATPQGYKSGAFWSEFDLFK